MKINWLIGILTGTALLLWAAAALLLWEDFHHENVSKLAVDHSMAKQMDRKFVGAGTIRYRKGAIEIKPSETNVETPVISVDELLSDLHIHHK